MITLGQRLHARGIRVSFGKLDLEQFLSLCVSPHQTREVLLKSEADECIFRRSFRFAGFSPTVFDHVLFKTVASHSISKLPCFSPQDKANTVWAFAKQDLLNQPFMDALAMESFRCISEYTQQHISNISWAFAKLLVHNTSLLTIFAGKIHVEIEQAQAQTLSSMAWSLARLAMRDPTSGSFLASISKAAQQRLPQFGAQEIANSS
eukprot:s2545_g7.t1